MRKEKRLIDMMKTDKQRINELMGYFGASKTPLMLRDKLKETLKEVRENERQTLFSEKTVDMALNGVEGALKTIKNLEAENAEFRKEIEIIKGFIGIPEGMFDAPVSERVRVTLNRLQEHRNIANQKLIEREAENAGLRMILRELSLMFEKDSKTKGKTIERIKKMLESGGSETNAYTTLDEDIVRIWKQHGWDVTKETVKKDCWIIKARVSESGGEIPPAEGKLGGRLAGHLRPQNNPDCAADKGSQSRIHGRRRSSR